MKCDYIFIGLLLSILTISSKSYSQDEFPVLKGPYLGQNPPGLTPEVFAPDIISISGRYEFGISFSPDLDAVYFSAQKKRRRSRYLFFKDRKRKVDTY